MVQTPFDGADVDNRHVATCRLVYIDPAPFGTVSMHGTRADASPAGLRPRSSRGCRGSRRSGIWPVVRLLDRALEGVRHRQLNVDAFWRDRVFEPTGIELFKFAGAHQLDQRFID